MDNLGVDIFRINLSHVDINKFENTIKLVKSWTNKPVCPDSEGAQLRTGNIKDDSLLLRTGSTIKFGNSTANKSKVDIPLNVDNPEELLLVGDLLKIDFNKYKNDKIQNKNINIIKNLIKLCNLMGIRKFIGIGSQAEYGNKNYKINEKISVTI